VPQELSPAPHLPLNKSTRKRHATIITPSDFLEKRKKAENFQSKKRIEKAHNIYSRIKRIRNKDLVR
jgi:hypothetical protein